MHKGTLRRLRIFDINRQRYVFEFDPGLTAMMEKLISKGLNLLNIASINEYPSECPADLGRSTSKKQRDARDGIGKDIA